MSPVGFSIQNRRPGTFPTLWVLKRRHDLSEHFRVMVEEVVKDSDVIVTRIVVESLPGAWVNVVADRPNRGGMKAVSPAEPDTPPDTPAHTQLTILADHVEWKAGQTNARSSS